MKKILALFLMLTVMLTGAALAEDGYDWYQYDDGFEIMIPSDWDQYEVPEDAAAEGIFDIFASADGAFVVQVAWTALEAEVTMQELLPAYVEAYPDAEVIEINGIEFLGFTDVENESMCICALDGAEPGLYMFVFIGIASDEDVTIATNIATSIRNIE